MTNRTTTELELDEIAGRAAGLYEYATGLDAAWQDEADQLAGTDVPALIADLRRARDRVAELEAFAYGCDAEGCVLPHSSWCEAAKKTAAANDGCTCGRPWTGHPQPHAMHCWTVNPPRAEVEEMRKRIAELSASVAPDAASEATSAPLRPSQPSSVSESAQSPTGAPEGAPRASGALEPDSPLPDRLEAVLTQRFTELGNPYSRMRIASQGPDGWPASKEVGPHDVAEVLRELLAVAENPGPADDFTGTQPCGHDDYHDPHPWHDRPNTWCPGHSHDDDQDAITEETAR